MSGICKEQFELEIYQLHIFSFEATADFSRCHFKSIGK